MAGPFTTIYDIKTESTGIKTKKGRGWTEQIQEMKELLVLQTPLMKVQYNEPLKHVELISNYRNLSEQKRFGHLVLYLETFSKTGHITQHFKTLRAIPVTAATIYPVAVSQIGRTPPTGGQQ